MDKLSNLLNLVGRRGCGSHGLLRLLRWVCLVGVMSAADALPGRAVQIWLAPASPVYTRGADPDIGSDLQAMFQPGAPWTEAAKHVAVVKLMTQFVRGAPDGLLASLFSDLARRNIRLAVEGLMLTGRSCGAGIEGYDGPNAVADLAARVQRLGGDLAYVAMDEPLWYGHHYSGANACHSPISEVAQDVATKITAMRRYFPNIQVGDIEPVGVPETSDWMAEMTEWVRAYHKAVGVPLPFFHADIQWGGQWRTQLRVLAEDLCKTGIRLGVGYAGNPADYPQQWIQRAEQRSRMTEMEGVVMPDDAILQICCNLHPPHNIPEDNDSTFTYLVDQYFWMDTVAMAEVEVNQVGSYSCKHQK